MAPVTNYQKVNGLKKHKFVSWSSGSQKSKQSPKWFLSLGWNQGVGRQYSFLEALGRIHFLDFFSFGRRLTFLGFWPPSILKVSDGWSLSHLTTLTYLPLPLTFKDPDGDTGPTQVIQDESPQLKILHLITSAKALLPHEVTHVHKVQMWMWPRPNPLNFCGAINLPATYIHILFYA